MKSEFKQSEALIDALARCQIDNLEDCLLEMSASEIDARVKQIIKRNQDSYSKKISATSKFANLQLCQIQKSLAWWTHNSYTKHRVASQIVLTKQNEFFCIFSSNKSTSWYYPVKISCDVESWLDNIAFDLGSLVALQIHEYCTIRDRFEIQEQQQKTKWVNQIGSEKRINRYREKQEKPPSPFWPYDIYLTRVLNPDCEGADFLSLLNNFQDPSTHCYLGDHTVCFIQNPTEKLKYDFNKMWEESFKSCIAFPETEDERKSRMRKTKQTGSMKCMERLAQFVNTAEKLTKN